MAIPSGSLARTSAASMTPATASRPSPSSRAAASLTWSERGMAIRRSSSPEKSGPREAAGAAGAGHPEALVRLGGDGFRDDVEVHGGLQVVAYLNDGQELPEELGGDDLQEVDLGRDQRRKRLPTVHEHPGTAQEAEPRWPLVVAVAGVLVAVARAASRLRSLPGAGREPLPERAPQRAPEPDPRVVLLDREGRPRCPEPRGHVQRALARSRSAKPLDEPPRGVLPGPEDDLVVGLLPARSRMKVRRTPIQLMSGS